MSIPMPLLAVYSLHRVSWFISVGGYIGSDALRIYAKEQ